MLMNTGLCCNVFCQQYCSALLHQIQAQQYIANTVDGKTSFSPVEQQASTSLTLWKHHVNLLLRSFRSVSSDFVNIIVSTDEEPSLGIERLAIKHLRGVSTKLN